MLKSRGVFCLYTFEYSESYLPLQSDLESSENLKLICFRGLQICDRNKAIQYLDNIGYYRLSAYMYPLVENAQTAHLKEERFILQEGDVKCFVALVHETKTAHV